MKRILFIVINMILFSFSKIYSVGQTNVFVKKAGSLSSILTKEQQDTCTSLILEGKLNSADVILLRRMAGYTEYGGCAGKLEKVDMSAVKFVNDEKPYMTLDAATENIVVYLKPFPKPKKTMSELRGNGLDETFHWKSPYNESSFSNDRYTFGYKQYFIKSCFLINAVITNGSKTIWTKDNTNGREAAALANGTLSKDDWKKLKSRRMTKTTGHWLSMNGSQCKWNACTHKNYFPADMFYKCPLMKNVILPRKMVLDERVRVYGSTIKYSYPENEQFLSQRNLDKFNKRAKRTKMSSVLGKLKPQNASI